MLEPAYSDRKLLVAPSAPSVSLWLVVAQAGSTEHGGVLTGSCMLWAIRESDLCLSFFCRCFICCCSSSAAFSFADCSSSSAADSLLTAAWCACTDRRSCVFALHAVYAADISYFALLESTVAYRWRRTCCYREQYCCMAQEATPRALSAS